MPKREWIAENRSSMFRRAKCWKTKTRYRCWAIMGGPDWIPVRSLTARLAGGPDEMLLAECTFDRLSVLPGLLGMELNLLYGSLKIGDLIAAPFFNLPAIGHQSSMLLMLPLLLILLLDGGGLKPIELLLQLDSAALQPFTFLSGGNLFSQCGRLVALGGILVANQILSCSCLAVLGLFPPVLLFFPLPGLVFGHRLERIDFRRHLGDRFIGYANVLVPLQMPVGVCFVFTA